MRRLASLGVALLLVAGCATRTEPPGQAGKAGKAGPASASSVAWMTEFCTVADDLRTALWGSATDPGSHDPAALRKSFDTQLSAASDALQTAADQLGGLPANPPPGAAEAATDLSGQLTTLRGTVHTGQQSLAALPEGASESDLGAVMGTVWPKVAARAGKPLDGLAITADMKAAATDLPCQAMPGLR